MVKIHIIIRWVQSVTATLFCERELNDTAFTFLFWHQNGCYNFDPDFDNRVETSKLLIVDWPVMHEINSTIKFSLTKIEFNWYHNLISSRLQLIFVRSFWSTWQSLKWVNKLRSNFLFKSKFKLALDLTLLWIN